MSSYSDPGGFPSNRPAAIESWQSRTQYESRPDQVHMVPLALEPTKDPAWPEDEAMEEQASREAGREIPRKAGRREARKIAEELRLELPDRLPGCLLKLPENPIHPTAEYNYYGISVPTTLLAPPDLTPVRMRLRLILEDARGNAQPTAPVAYFMHPDTEVATEITHIGEFRIDIGTAVNSLLRLAWPWMPDLLTLRGGGSVDVTRTRARVQAGGLQNHECEWRIADTELSYNFNPSCVVQVPKETHLLIRARLNIDVRRRVARTFHKTYLETARPRSYILKETDYKTFELVKPPAAPVIAVQDPDTFSDKLAAFLHLDEPLPIGDRLSKWVAQHGIYDTSPRGLLRALKERI